MVQTDIHTDELYFQGTAYTPKAWLDIRLVGVTGQVFRAGLVARTVSLNVSPSNGYEGPLDRAAGQHAWRRRHYAST